MLSEVMISRPRYGKIEPKTTGRWHLLLVQREDLLDQALNGATGLDDFDETWMIVSRSDALPQPNDVQKRFRSTAHLRIALDRRLNSETMGLKIYIIGEELFVWDIDRQCRNFGMRDEEITLFAPYFGNRRVRCAHCRAYTLDCETNIVSCSGCGAKLLVRDHFSRFWNSYQGFQIDAEIPGEIPASEAFGS